MGRWMMGAQMEQGKADPGSAVSAICKIPDMHPPRPEFSIKTSRKRRNDCLLPHPWGVWALPDGFI